MSSDPSRRSRRGAAGATDGVEHAGERDVVEVVTRCLRERPVLSPPRHAAVHKSWIQGEAIVGTYPEPFCDPRSKAFDENIG